MLSPRSILGHQKTTTLLADTPDDDEELQSDADAEKPGKFRQKLADAEAARDTALAQLVAQRRAVFEAAIAGAGLPLAVAQAAGLGVDQFLNAEGLVDVESLSVIAEEVRANAGIPRRPKPLPHVGQGRNEPAAETLGDLLKREARGSH
jgi:hypothetical protein